jgi:hypothetical protein
MDIESIINLAHSDTGLGSSQKQELSKEENKRKLEKALSGVGGAALGLAAAKYAKLSKMAQTLLSAAGFGIGVLIYDYINRPRFANYDDKSKSYQIDTNKF